MQNVNEKTKLKRPVKALLSIHSSENEGSENPFAAADFLSSNDLTDRRPCVKKGHACHVFLQCLVMKMNVFKVCYLTRRVLLRSNKSFTED